MVKRTTVILDDDVYEKLVREGKLNYGDIVLQTYGRKEEVLYVVKIIYVI